MMAHASQKLEIWSIEKSLMVLMQHQLRAYGQYLLECT